MSEAEAENALDDFFGHKRSRFQTDLTEPQRYQVIIALVAQARIAVPLDIVEYLAREIRCYRGALERAFLEFLSYGRASQQQLTLALAERFVDDLWIWPIKDACCQWNPALTRPSGFFGYILACYTWYLLGLVRPRTTVDALDLTDKEILRWLSRSPEVRDPLLEKALTECAHQLTTQEALVYSLRLDHQLDYSEIGRRLNTSEGHARVIHFRARKNILKCLAMKGIHK